MSFDQPLPNSRRVLAATAALVGIHLALLLFMLPDYMADNDLGYHVSLARQYAEHGSFFWDDINWAPTGRPNLQGPLLHYAVGLLGLALGGDGDSYVLAFSMLAVLQWCAAVFTAVFFARRYGGDWAALIAAALLTGCIWSAASFFVGVPSGWIFVLTPWAIHFLLRDRYVLAALLTSAVMYVHLGGAPVAPFGIVLAAVLTRRWKGLFLVGGMTAILTSTFLVHFYLHRDWYNGQRGHVAGDIAVLTYILAAPGLLWLLRRPKTNLFLLIWPLAPLAWLFQDGLRFFLQSTVAASAIAGVFVAQLLPRIRHPLARGATVTALVLLATVYPLSIPALPVELAWATGRGFPRELDWGEVRQLAAVLEEAGLQDRIVKSYYVSLSSGMMAYTPFRQEGGHWGEVRPPENPARGISAGEKVYILPLPPDDPVLARFEQAGWVKVHGGSDRTAIATLPAAATLDEALPLVAEIAQAEAAWLAENAVNNTMPPAGDMLNPARIADFRERTTTQRNHTGRIMAAILVYAYALEEAHPEAAAETRGTIGAWGSMANFLGDETAIGYLSDRRFALFRENIGRWADAAETLTETKLPSDELKRLTAKLFDDFFG